MTQGSKANKTGRVMEGLVKSIFTDHGYQIVSFRKWKQRPEKHGPRLLLTYVPYTSIYKHAANSEFLVKTPGYPDIRIECKWQQSPGSVDEKFPYVYLNAIEAYPENNVIILLDGGGAKPGAIEWLKQAVAGKEYAGAVTKDIQVLTMSEFTKWANTFLAQVGT